MRLSIPTLGTILRLADRVTAQNNREREEDGEGGDCEKTIERIRASLTDNRAKPRAESDLEAGLETLSNQERTDLVGLYGLGRWAFDTRAEAREHSGHRLDLIPWILAQRTDLHDSVVNGLKRLGESHEATATEHGDDSRWVVIWSPEEWMGDVVRLDWFNKERDRVFMSDSSPTCLHLGEPFATQEEARRFLASEQQRKAAQKSAA